MPKALFNPFIVRTPFGIYRKSGYTVVDTLFDSRGLFIRRGCVYKQIEILTETILQV